MALQVCPSIHPRTELQGGFAVYPVPRPLYLHDPPRKAYDGFNASLRDGYSATYKWGDGEGNCGHEGVDLGCVKKYTRVSQAEGVVWYVDTTDNSSAGVHVAILTKCPECAGWFLFRYLHLLVGTVAVTKGQVVHQGDLIGTQGMSGNAHWYHSHFEIRHTTNPTANTVTTYPGDWGTPYDPLAWLDAPPPDAGEPEFPSTVRVAGANRYATAAKVSQFAWLPDDVVVVSGANFPDAVTVGPKVGTVLLTDPRNLPPEIAAELARLAPTRVVIVGGPTAVSVEVRRAISEVITP